MQLGDLPSRRSDALACAVRTYTARGFRKFQVTSALNKESQDHRQKTSTRAASGCSKTRRKRKRISLHNSISNFFHLQCKIYEFAFTTKRLKPRLLTAVGFEPTPLRTDALSQRLRPLGQTVLVDKAMLSLARCSQSASSRLYHGG